MKRLRCYFNWLALDGLGSFANGPVDAIKSAGYDGIQFIDPLDRAALEQAHAVGLGVCGSSRVNEPGEADLIAQIAADAGLECLTLHLGWGMESNDEGARLIDAILEASTKPQSIPSTSCGNDSHMEPDHRHGWQPACIQDSRSGHAESAPDRSPAG